VYKFVSKFQKACRISFNNFTRQYFPLSQGITDSHRFTGNFFIHEIGRTELCRGYNFLLSVEVVDGDS